MILLFWGELEADFLKHYGVDRPLRLTWRKFLILLRNLPSESFWRASVHYEQQWEDPDWRREMRDRHFGREGTGQVNRMTVDEWMATGG